MKSWCLAGLVVAATLLGGCTADYIPIIDPKPDTGTVSAETSAPKTVDLVMWKAWYWNNEVTIMGTAQPSALAGKEKISGFIDVEFLDKDNNVIQTAMASLNPGTLSSDQPSLYKISIWTKHPAQSHLKIVFIDQRDEAAYLGSGSGLGAAGTASSSGNYTRVSGGNTADFGTFGRGINGVGNTSGVSGLSVGNGVSR